MTIMRARVALAVSFLVSLIIQAVAIIVTYSEEAISYKDLSTLITKLLSVYAIHLAIIFGGIFAQHQNAKQKARPEQAPGGAFWIAIVLAVMWNMLLVWRSVKFGMAAFDVTSEDNVNHLSNYIDTIASAGSFLVAGALTFFFSKR